MLVTKHVLGISISGSGVLFSTNQIAPNKTCWRGFPGGIFLDQSDCRDFHVRKFGKIICVGSDFNFGSDFEFWLDQSDCRDFHFRFRFGWVYYFRPIRLLLTKHVRGIPLGVFFSTNQIAPNKACCRDFHGGIFLDQSDCRDFHVVILISAVILNFGSTNQIAGIFISGFGLESDFPMHCKCLSKQ